MISSSCMRRPPFGTADLFRILVLFCLGVCAEAVAGQAAITSEANSIEIPTKEISVFEVPQRFRSYFLRGRQAVCNQTQLPSVKYPTDMPDKALFGVLRLSNILNAIENRGSLNFALGATGSDYDRLYFDCDGDLDLTDETPVAPRKNIPADASPRNPTATQETYFDDVEVTFDLGSHGKQTVKLIPRLLVRPGMAQVTFLASTLHRADFQIDASTCQAYLGYMYSIDGRLDQPNTGLILVRDGMPQLWAGGYTLTVMHEIDGRLFRFASTPTGDKLTLRPYEGPLGTFEMGKGDRDIKALSMSGSLHSKETTVAVAYAADPEKSKPINTVRLPVGDYYPLLLTVTLDQLQVLISNNYYQDSLGRTRGQREPVYGFEIREDRPFVLDFAAKPQVVFTEPQADARIKPGQTLQVKAVMIDPDLDIMIRRLYDTSNGRSVSLEPKVVIARANGETVAEGVMPFG